LMSAIVLHLIHRSGIAASSITNEILIIGNTMRNAH